MDSAGLPTILHQRRPSTGFGAKIALGRRRTHDANRSRSRKPALERLEGRALLATFTVTNTNDDTNSGSLRWAITQSNATPGSNIINFDIAPSGVQVINLDSALPTITVPVTIDGLTEPGTTSTPTIEVYCTGEVYVDGLDVTAGDTTIEGLVIDNVSGIRGSAIDLSVAGGDTIRDDFINNDPTGTTTPSGLQNGIFVQANCDNNTIRGNLISAENGIVLNGSVAGASGTTTSGNLIAGNILDLDITGTQAIGYEESIGIDLLDAPGTTIGGTTAADRNLIANTGTGIQLDSNSVGSIVEGNYLGTDITGEVAIGDSDGISIPGSMDCTIGGTNPGSANVISAGSDYGIFVNTNSGNLVIEGNLIGTDATGTKPLGNAKGGIDLYGGNDSTIGGSVAAAANVISANGGDGIVMSARDAFIEGNLIGTDITGTKPMGNAGDGVFSNGPIGMIGGPAPQDGNLIANNGSGSSTDRDGVQIYNNNVTVLSNSIHDNASLGIASDEYSGVYIQPTPVLTSAASSGTGGTINGTLTSAAGTYTLQFFSNADLDPSGNAEGQTLLGTQTIKITGSSAAFSEPIPSGFAAGTDITATATNAAGDSSQFSPGILATTLGPPAITGVASAQTVADGQRVTDTFTIANLKTAADAGVAFSDPIPAGTTFVSGTTSTGAPVTLSAGVATAAIGSLAAGQSVTVSITLMTSPAAEPSFANIAGVTATTPAVAAGTDTVGVTTTVTPSADLAVAITPPAATTTTGRLTFVAKVTNNGPDPAAGLTLVDTFTLPTGATIASETASQGTVSLSGDVLTANFGNLADAASATLTIVVIVKNNVTLVDAAVVSSTSADPNSANNSASVTLPVRGVAAVSLSPSLARSTPQKAVTLTAQVSVPPGFPAASKTVTFYDATTPLGTAALNAAGVATLAVDLIAVGTHNIAAVYSGDANYAALVSTPAPVKIADPVYGDFDGDGKSDVAIYDQSSGTFAVSNSGGGTRVALLGNPRDVNLPDYGDFDGDGKTDLAVYDQTAATFHVIDSASGVTVSVALGNPLDKNFPVPGDFLGVGRTNYAIYDQTTATFYVLESGKVVSQQLGIPGDVNTPVAGDFDGDGKADFAVFDQTRATFLILDSGGGGRVQQLGNSRDVNIPIAGDFDGDGRTDLAIYDQTQSTFLILESGGGSIVRPFSVPGDVNVPVLGDFGGEGRADIAIFDTTIAEFLVLEWGGGSIVQKYGNPQSKNVPD